MDLKSTLGYDWGLSVKTVCPGQIHVDSDCNGAKVMASIKR